MTLCKSIHCGNKSDFGIILSVHKIYSCYSVIPQTLIIIIPKSLYIYTVNFGQMQLTFLQSVFLRFIIQIKCHNLQRGTERLTLIYER